MITAFFDRHIVGEAPLTGELHIGATLVQLPCGCCCVPVTTTRAHLSHEAARAELAAQLEALGFELVTN